MYGQWAGTDFLRPHKCAPIYSSYNRKWLCLQLMLIVGTQQFTAER